MTNWKLFAKTLETYLGQLLGSECIPLHFIIRCQAHYDPNTQFASEQEQAVWYDTLCYYDEDPNFPQEHRNLGKWLGVAHRV
jgi:hypothetical protein